MDDQRTFWMAVVTAVMWASLAVISIIFMRLPDTTALGAAVFIIMMAGIGVGGMAAVWDSGREKSASSARQEQPAGAGHKVKRMDPERLARLMETLDEDQIIELESLLMSRQVGDILNE